MALIPGPSPMGCVSASLRLVVAASLTVAVAVAVVAGGLRCWPELGPDARRQDCGILDAAVPGLQCAGAHSCMPVRLWLWL